MEIPSFTFLTDSLTCASPWYDKTASITNSEGAAVPFPEYVFIFPINGAFSPSSIFSKYKVFNAAGRLFWISGSMVSLIIFRVIASTEGHNLLTMLFSHVALSLWDKYFAATENDLNLDKFISSATSRKFRRFCLLNAERYSPNTCPKINKIIHAKLIFHAPNSHSMEAMIKQIRYFRRSLLKMIWNILLEIELWPSSAMMFAPFLFPLYKQIKQKITYFTESDEIVIQSLS